MLSKLIPKKNQYVVILTGGTGVGKSTLTNVLSKGTLNFKVGNSMNSETKFTEKGSFIDEDGNEIIIIDTPGFFDTKGKDQDKKNMENIKTFIKNEIRISSIIIMLNFQEERANSYLKEMIKKIYKMFPTPDFWDHSAFCWNYYNINEYETEEEFKGKRKYKEENFLNKGAFGDVIDDAEKEGINRPSKLNMFFLDLDPKYINEEDLERDNQLENLMNFITSRKPIFKEVKEENVDYEHKVKVGEPETRGNSIIQEYKIYKGFRYIDFSGQEYFQELNSTSWKETTIITNSEEEVTSKKEGNVTTFTHTIYKHIVLKNENNNNKEVDKGIDKTQIVDQWTDKEEITESELTEQAEINQINEDLRTQNFTKKIIVKITYFNRKGEPFVKEEKEDISRRETYTIKTLKGIDKDRNKINDKKTEIKCSVYITEILIDKDGKETILKNKEILDSYKEYEEEIIENRQSSNEDDSNVYVTNKKIKTIKKTDKNGKETYGEEIVLDSKTEKFPKKNGRKLLKIEPRLIDRQLVEKGADYAGIIGGFVTNGAAAIMNPLGGFGLGCHIGKVIVGGFIEKEIVEIYQDELFYDDGTIEKGERREQRRPA